MNDGNCRDHVANDDDISCIVPLSQLVCKTQGKKSYASTGCLGLQICQSVAKIALFCSTCHAVLTTSNCLVHLLQQAGLPCSALQG